MPIPRPEPGRRFTFDGDEYSYAIHDYNRTWANERAVEVPIALRALEGAAGSVLEVGNVLTHYTSTSHEVVDKYESAGDGVRAMDVMDVPIDRRHDTVICVSTVEHVAWDEDDRQPDKAPQAVHRLEKLVAPGGRLIVTWAVGYHRVLDRALFEGALPVEPRFMVRVSRHDWREAAADEVRRARYDWPWPGGNSLVVARERSTEA